MTKVKSTTRRGHDLQGKLDTEKLLTDKGVTFTSVRPVYIYGPLNYNPVEEWFFHRIKAGRPIPVPNSGQQVYFWCSVDVQCNVIVHFVHQSKHYILTHPLIGRCLCGNILSSAYLLVTPPHSHAVPDQQSNVQSVLRWHAAEGKSSTWTSL